MRMIDFRAWDKKESEILDVMDIDFSGNKVGVCNIPKRMFKNGRLHTIHSIEKDWSEVELMQSTGLKDKNGVEIYEGDIVRVLDRLDDPPFEAEGHIVYEQDDCAFEIAVGFYRYSLHRTKFVEYEIIGNIYENSELLEEEE